MTSKLDYREILYEGVIKEKNELKKKVEVYDFFFDELADYMKDFLEIAQRKRKKGKKERSEFYYGVSFALRSTLESIRKIRKDLKNR